MAASVVVDSSIALATILKESYSNRAADLLAQWHLEGVQLAAPMLFRYEVVAVIRKAVWQERLTANNASAKLATMLRLPIQYYIDNALLERAYFLAMQLNRPTAYDAQYLAVAERLKCVFWTADERLFNATRSTLSWIQWISNYSPPIT